MSPVFCGSRGFMIVRALLPLERRSDLGGGLVFVLLAFGGFSLVRLGLGVCVMTPRLASVNLDIPPAVSVC